MTWPPRSGGCEGKGGKADRSIENLQIVSDFPFWAYSLGGTFNKNRGGMKCD